jgi:hypothetical protein
VPKKITTIASRTQQQHSSTMSKQLESISLDQDDNHQQQLSSENTKYWLSHTTPNERKYVYRSYSIPLVNKIKNFKEKDDIAQFQTEGLLKHLKSYHVENIHDNTVQQKLLFLPPLCENLNPLLNVRLINHSLCDCDDEMICNENICWSELLHLKTYYLYKWNNFKMCYIYEFQIVLALAIDNNATAILSELTHCELLNASFSHLCIIRDIYAPACKLIFPHLSPEENTINQTKRFQYILKLSKPGERSWNYERQIEYNSIIFDLMNEIGYDLCKDHFFTFLDTASYYGEGLYNIFLKMIPLIQSRNYHYGIRWCLDFYSPKLKDFYYMEKNIDAFINTNWKKFTKDEYEKNILKLKQCFMIYSTEFKTHEIIQRRVISKLQSEWGIANIIARFLSMVPYPKHKKKRKRQEDDDDD